MSHRSWAICVAILTFVFALSPALSSRFAGFTKDQFPVVLDHWPAQPAGWTFSIWGVIYAWLIIGAIYGLWKRTYDIAWQLPRPALSISLAIGIFWIMAANAAPILATLMILIMALFAIRAMLYADDTDRWLLAAPLGLYAGWLTAASGVAVAVTLSGYGLLGAQTAAMAALLLVLIVGLTFQSRKPQVVTYPIAIGWALIGIIAANLDAAQWPVAILAGIGIIALAVQSVRITKRVKA